LEWHRLSIETTSSLESPEGRRSHSALEVNGSLLIFGGFNGRNHKHFEDVWLLSPEQELPAWVSPIQCSWHWRCLSPAGDAPGKKIFGCYLISFLTLGYVRHI